MNLQTSRRGRAWVVALAVAIGLLMAGCASDAPQSVLEPAGESARKADGLWNLTFSIAVAVFVFVQAALIYSVIRYRAKPGREARQFEGNARLEVILTVIPALILAAIAVPTVGTIFDLAGEPKGDDVLQVNVQGRQYWWLYEYPDLDVVTANELHIPVGTPVNLTIEGYDVNHSFWVPRLAGTQDVVPGRVNRLTLEADEPGTYRGQCKEFCGLSHANMALRVIAHEPAAFETWIAEQQQPSAKPAGSLAAEGAKLFVNGSEDGQFAAGAACASCHAIEGLDGALGVIGPNLTHLQSRQTFAAGLFKTNEANLRAWLADPPARKPGSQMPDVGLTEGQIDALVAYLETLK
ncbi:MAG: cytochrome c oxidase subunit II [Actinomycetota bacterium]|nr:cytochrome c oxidase subunit II [Actinomycetota bacterium]